MPSPFPGMNPYVEQAYDWNEFHNNFISRIQKVLSGLVGPNYLVKMEFRLLLHERSAEERRFLGRADVGVVSNRERPKTAAVSVLDAPVQLQLPAVDIEKEAFLEIRDMHKRRLVTVIEMLSPSNKTPGDDRETYMAKRREVLSSSTHLVEIDFRRGGKRPSPPELPLCDYYVLVSRHEDRPNIGVWPFGLRDPLPTIPIPLVAPDSPVKLDLKAVLDLTYDDANYGKHIYLESPDPPLRSEDEAWAVGLFPVGWQSIGNAIS